MATVVSLRLRRGVSAAAGVLVVLLCWLPGAGAGYLLAASGTGETPEFRGLWVDAFGPGFYSTNEVKKLVADCRKYNFNAVLVEMRRRGDAFYTPGPGNPDPRTTALPEKFDALAEIIKECHTGAPRIEVHCWLVSHFVWAWKRPPSQSNHVFNLHPEYLTKDSIGQKHLNPGYFLDPGNPDANQWIHDVAKDVVSRYDIDGLHWDYCRYPERDSGYNEVAIKRYNDEFALKGQPSPDDPRFCGWRRRQVSDFLRWANADMLEINPRLVISASVFANLTDSFGYRLADWAGWCREGIVDLCIPMNFSTNNERVFFPRAESAFTNQGARYVYMGQAGYTNTAEQSLMQLGRVREIGFHGFAFYSYRNPNAGEPAPEEAFSIIRDRLQPHWAGAPELPWKKARGLVKGIVTDAGRPVYNAVVTLRTSSGVAVSARAVRTEPHGSFAFFDIEPGRYDISAEVRGTAITRQVAARAAAVTDASLRLAGPRR